MSKKSIMVEMDKNGYSYVVLSLVSIESILIKTMPLLGSRRKFWTILQIENHRKTAFQIFVHF